MKNYAILLLFTLSLVSQNLAAQQNFKTKLDSLETQLKKDIDKEEKVNILNSLSQEYFYSYEDSVAFNRVDKAIALAAEIEYMSGLAEGFRNKSILESGVGNDSVSFNMMNMSLNICIEYSDTIGLAYNYILMGDYYLNTENNIPKAEEYYLKAVRIGKNHSDKRVIAKAKLQYGIIFIITGDFSKASGTYIETLKLGEELKNDHIIAVSNYFIGGIEHFKDNFPKAIYHYQKALELYEKNGYKKRIPSVSNSIGNIYTNIEEFAAADEYFQKSLKILEERDDNKLLEFTNAVIGMNYREEGKYTDALIFLKRSLELSRRLNEQYKIADANREIAHCYLKLDSLNNALFHYNNSLDICLEIENNLMLADIYTGLAKVYIKKNNEQEGYNFAKRAFDLAINIDDKELKKNSAEALSNAYKLMNDHKKALEYYEIYKLASDSLEQYKNIKKIAFEKYQAELEKEKKEFEIEQLKNLTEHEIEMLKQKRIRISLLIGIAAISLIVILIAYAYTRIRRAKNIIAAQKQDIESKNEDLKLQNEEISTQRDEIENQKQIVEKAHDNMQESINYAKRIQTALLPPEAYIEEVLNDYFIINLPRNIVSGDFYWFKQVQEYQIFIVADCTGHGVPGAFMSMLGIAFLNEIVQRREITQPGHLLTEMRKQVKRSLRQTGKDEETKDGMDMAVCVINSKTKMMQYAGAYNPVYIIRKEEFYELDPDRMPVGIQINEKAEFTYHDFQLEEGDNIYMFSDGFCDQFGGPKGKKYLRTRFKDLLTEINDLSMSSQKDKLLKDHLKWKNINEQTDDILVAGIKIQ